jgi:hypothetical protein
MDCHSSGWTTWELLGIFKIDNIGEGDGWMRIVHACSCMLLRMGQLRICVTDDADASKMDKKKLSTLPVAPIYIWI